MCYSRYPRKGHRERNEIMYALSSSVYMNYLYHKDGQGIQATFRVSDMTLGVKEMARDGTIPLFNFPIPVFFSLKLIFLN